MTKLVAHLPQWMKNKMRIVEKNTEVDISPTHYRMNRLHDIYRIANEADFRVVRCDLLNTSASSNIFLGPFALIELLVLRISSRALQRVAKQFHRHARKGVTLRVRISCVAHSPRPSGSCPRTSRSNAGIRRSSSMSESARNLAPQFTRVNRVYRPQKGCEPFTPPRMPGCKERSRWLPLT